MKPGSGKNKWFAKDAKNAKKSPDMNGTYPGQNSLGSSFPRKRESSDFKKLTRARRWMPAFAGMTTLRYKYSRLVQGFGVAAWHLHIHVRRSGGTDIKLFAFICFYLLLFAFICFYLRLLRPLRIAALRFYPSPESRVPSPESRVPSPESRVPSPESRVPSRRSAQAAAAPVHPCTRGTCTSLCGVAVEPTKEMPDACTSVASTRRIRAQGA
jgi:hypothetical protein